MFTMSRKLVKGRNIWRLGAKSNSIVLVRLLSSLLMLNPMFAALAQLQTGLAPTQSYPHLVLPIDPDRPEFALPQLLGMNEQSRAAILFGGFSPNYPSTSGPVGLLPLSRVPTTVYADKDAVTKAVQASNAAHKLRNSRLSEIFAPVLGLFVDTFTTKVNGQSIVTDPIGAGLLFKQAYRRGRNITVGSFSLPPKEALKYGLDIGKDVYTLATSKNVIERGLAVGSLLISAYELDILGQDALRKSQVNQIAQPLKNTNIEGKVDQYIKKKVEQAQEIAKNDPKFKEAFDSLHAEFFNVSITDDGYTVIQKNLDLPEYWRTIIAPDGTISTSLGALEERFRQDCQAANSITSDSVVRLRKLPISYFSTAANRALLAQYEREAEERRYKENEKKINDIASTVSFISGLVGKINPKLGREIGIVGGGAVEIARAINNFKKTTELIFDNFLLKGFNFTDNFKNFVGGAVLTGNIVGIALNVFSMLGGGGPSPEQVILEQIAELRKEIQQMRREMHERFDQIDRNLNQIYDRMNERFDQIDFRVGRLQANLDEVRTELVSLHEKLNRVERNIYDWIEEEGKRPLKLGINEAIGYKERFGVDMPYQPDYIRYERLFHIWATIISKDQVEAMPNNRNYDDSKIYDELNFPLEANINYLAQFPARNPDLKNLGLKPLSNIVLANPHVWGVSSEAYLQLAREWPAYDKRVSPMGLQEIYQTGQQIRSAVENIATVPSGTGRKANRQLFDALFAKYRGKALSLRDVISTFEQDTLKHFSQVGMNIWGGANQTTNQTPNLQSINACNGRTMSLNIPPNVLSRIPNVARLADLLASRNAPGASRVNVCLDIKWLVRRTDAQGTQFGNPAFTLIFSIQGKTIYAPYIYFAREYRVSYDAATINSWLDAAAQHWTQPNGWTNSISADFADGEDGEYFADESDRQLRQRTLGDLSIQIEQSLRKVQAQYYAQVASELLKAGNMQTAARNLSGVKGLLDAYIAFGLSRSLETNDYLRSLLYGSEQAPDEKTISEIYDAAAVLLNDNQPVPKIDISEIASRRLNDLARVVNEILGSIQQSYRDGVIDPVLYNYPESLDLVDSTLHALEAHNTAVTLGQYLVAHPRSLNLKINEPQELTLTATDSAGAQLSFSIVNQPQHGALAGTAPDLIYTPARDYSGEDSFTFKASNGAADSNVATVSITITNTACSLLGFKVPKYFDVGTGPYAVVANNFNGDSKLDLAVVNRTTSNISVLLGEGTGGFGEATNFPAGSNPYSIVAGDFNGDRKTDLVVNSRDGDDKIYILLGDGQGSFEAPKGYTVGQSPYGLATGDFNKDGRLDLAVTNHRDHTVIVMLGDGLGFKSMKSYSVGRLPYLVSTDDFNKDGNLDLVVANHASDKVSVLLGDGRGDFGVAANFEAGSNPVQVGVGDFNGDGASDLVVGNAGANTVSVLLGDGTGRFSEPKSFDVGGRGYYLSVADYNRDGKLDVAVTQYNSDRLSLLLGDGRGGLVLTNSYFVGDSPISIIAKDFNGDTSPDLAVTNFGHNNVAILTGSGDGGLSAALNFSVGTKPYSVAVDDFNGDGKPDLVTANHYSKSVSVLLGNGAGAFSKAIDYEVGTKPVFIATGDFNNDQRVDLAVTDLGEGQVIGSGRVSILLGDGTGGFTRLADIPVGTEPFSITTADFNKDGKLDLAVTDVHTSKIEPNIYILLGNGAGGFTMAPPVTAKRTPRYINAADFNKDGKTDLVVANSNSNDVTFLLGNGSGGFTEATTLGLGDGPIYQVVDDFDKDGYSDLAVVHIRLSQNVAVMLGAEGARFEGFTNYDLGARPSTAVSGDFDLDGNLDLAIAHEVSNGVLVLNGNGQGGFIEAGNFGAGFESYSIAKGDFNQDGKPDLVVANYSANSVSILLNTTCKPAPTAPALATVSAASYKGIRVAPDSIAATFGVGLATDAQVATAVPLPTSLAGTTVKVKDSAGTERLAPLFFVSPGQINYLVPPETLRGTATVTIASGDGKVSSGSIQIDPVVPGLFSANASGQGVAAAVVLRVKADGSQSFEFVARFDSAQKKFVAVPIDLGADTDQLFLILFGTGHRYRSSLSVVSALIGGEDAETLYVGPQGGFVGLDQINLRIPRNLAGRGEVDIVLNVDGVPANIVRIAIK